MSTKFNGMVYMDSYPRWGVQSGDLIAGTISKNEFTIRPVPQEKRNAKTDSKA